MLFLTLFLLLRSTAVVGSAVPTNSTDRAVELTKDDYGCLTHWLHPNYYNFMYAKCSDPTTEDEEIKLVTMDLNKCFVNKDGRLNWGRGGDAIKSCAQCYIENGHTSDPVYHCECTTGNKSKKRWSYINLREQLFKDDQGRLACFDQHGDKYDEFMRPPLEV